MEREIQQETVNIIKQLQNNNLGVSPQQMLAPAVMNILWRYVAGISDVKFFICLPRANKKWN